MIGLIAPTSVARLRHDARRSYRLVDIIRGTPQLQLFFIYYGLADAGSMPFWSTSGFPNGSLVLEPMVAAYVALGVNSGAYQAEYFRGAIQAVGSGQLTAARALGMTRLQAILHIVLSQALRLAVALVERSGLYGQVHFGSLTHCCVRSLWGGPKDHESTLQSDALCCHLSDWCILRSSVDHCLMQHFVEKRVAIPGVEVEAQRA